MKRAYRKCRVRNFEDKPEIELENKIRHLDSDFWRKEYEKFLEQHKTTITDSLITAEEAVLKMRREIRSLAHSKNLGCSFLSQGDYYYITLKPCMIHIRIGKDTGNISISLPHFNPRNYFYYEWQSALECINNYLDIDVTILEEVKRTLRERIFVNYKNSEIATASISSICNSYAKKSGMQCHIISCCLESEIIFYKNDMNFEIIKDLFVDDAGKKILRMFQIQIYHKAFLREPALLIDILRNPRTIEIENTIKCTKLQTMTKTPQEILVGSDINNMCISCAIGILNNPSDDYRLRFEATCKRAGLAFIQLQTNNNTFLYFFMNITEEDAEKYFETNTLKTLIFIQKKFSMRIDSCLLVFRLLQWNTERKSYEMKMWNNYDDNVSASLESFFEIYNPEIEIPYTFTELSMQFFQKFPWKSPFQLNEEAYVYLLNADKYSGSERMHYRCRMYHKPQAWELEDGLKNQYYERWKKEM